MRAFNSIQAILPAMIFTLAACGSMPDASLPTQEPSLTAATAAPTASPEATSAAPAPVDTSSPPSPVAVATSRGPDLEATDPEAVRLDSGGLQLIEFFRFT